jgi:hypothetical protein
MDIKELIKCPICKGDGLERCDNPDHGFIGVHSFLDVGRIGCPVCGHDPNHIVPGGGVCDACNGVGKVTKDVFKKIIIDYEIDI